MLACSKAIIFPSVGQLQTIVRIIHRYSPPAMAASFLAHEQHIRFIAVPYIKQQNPTVLCNVGGQMSNALYIQV